MLAMGERYLNYLVRECVEHYNRERQHQSFDKQPLPDVGESEPANVRDLLMRRRFIIYRASIPSAAY